MHFWADNTKILELTQQKVKIPASKTLENSGYLIVENTSTFNDNVTISGGDLTVSNSQGSGGRLGMGIANPDYPRCIWRW